MLTEDEREQQRELAASLDCLTKDEYSVLAGITDSTEEDRRKRGKAPPHIVAGNTILYPRAGVKQFLLDRVHVKRPSRDIL